MRKNDKCETRKNRSDIGDDSDGFFRLDIARDTSDERWIIEKTFECWKLMRTRHGERRSLLLQWEESRWNSAPSFCELETPDCPLRRLKPAFFPALSQAASVLHVIESLSCWSSSRCRDRRCSSEGTVIISFAIPCLLS